MSDPTSANLYIRDQLQDRLMALEKHLDADVLVLITDIQGGVDDVVRLEVEGIKNKKKKLVVMLETGGGSIEVVERMVNVFRHHYEQVEFIVPNHAMSAGTVLVMSGDAIHMDYYSVLGPIDPQVLGQNGKLVPALGYLERYDALIKKSGTSSGLTTAETAVLIEKFDQAELSLYEHAQSHTIALLEQWLVEYKFKNWNCTETKKTKVTLKMKKDRAKKIAKTLNDTKKWHSHRRGISMDVLTDDPGLKLQIDDFGVDKKLNKCIQNYYGLLKDYMRKMDYGFAFATREMMWGF